MKRIYKIRQFLEQEYKNRMIIEPESRFDLIKENLFKSISLHNPGVIVKAGLGNPELIFEIINNFDLYLVIVEPCFNNIKSFLKIENREKELSKIRIIIGDINFFPIDYYAADMIISIDYLDFIDSGKAIDEFKEATRFEGTLFLAGVVLNKEDIEGIYDEYIKLIFPIHNEYYLEDDLKTIMELNQYKILSKDINYIESDLNKVKTYIAEIFTIKEDSSSEFLKNNENDFRSFYKLDDQKLQVPYFTGTFMRLKPDKDINSPKL